ncbi:MAG: hypothetical protein M1826_006313 [Phylliscum demangeonii]|nr:MAG: hypothetical protein M1826_006313 [Phylliscum demangeonii]
MGNRRGRSVQHKLDAVDALASKFDEIESEIESKTAALDMDLDQMREQLAVPKASSEAYLQIRNNFPATYRRDILHHATAGDRGLRSAGNTVAHDGDPIGDAFLYERGLRTDEQTYLSLNGLSWTQVLRRRKSSGVGRRNSYLMWESFVITSQAENDRATMMLLTAHASAKADKQRPLETALRNAFQSFVATFDENWPTDYFDDPQTPASRAYWRFWEVWRDTGRKGA